MEIDQHWLHSHRKQVVKVTGHLLDARRHVLFTLQHSKLIGTHSEICKVIEGNIDALFIGIEETIKLCGQASDDFKNKMDDPDAVTAPTFGRFRRFDLTRFQHQLEKEGKANFDTIKSHESIVNKTKKTRVPIPFTLQPKPKPKQRKRTKNNFPL